MPLLTEVAATSSGVLLRCFVRRLFGFYRPGHSLAIDDGYRSDSIETVAVLAAPSLGWGLSTLYLWLCFDLPRVREITEPAITSSQAGELVR